MGKMFVDDREPEHIKEVASRHNMEELNKKLAEWAGFTEIIQLGSCLCGYPPDFAYDKNWSKPTVGIFPIPNFPQSLDACFKWLVPKLHRVSIIQEFNQPTYAEIVVQPEYEYIHYKEWAETPTLALCLAIEKLIDEQSS